MSLVSNWVDLVLATRSRACESRATSPIDRGDVVCLASPIAKNSGLSVEAGLDRDDIKFNFGPGFRVAENRGRDSGWLAAELIVGGETPCPFRGQMFKVGTVDSGL